jgi:uncharacterized membrane protein YfcA
VGDGYRFPTYTQNLVTWQFILTGFLIGSLVGVTGMGGGSLMTPILVLMLGFSPSVAVGTDILHGAIFKSVGAVRHRRLGNVQGRLSGWMFLGSAPMSLLGVAAATWMKHRYGSSATSVQGIILGIALVVGGVGMSAKALVHFREHPEGPLVLTRRDRVAAVLIGLGGGFIVGLTSVGSGVFFGLTMLIVFPLRSAKVVGTDIFHAAALLWVAGFGHLVAGNVDMHAVAWLLIGSIPGVLLTSGLTLRIPDRMLRLCLSVVLMASGVKLVGLPHANESAIAVLLTGFGILLAVRLARRQRFAEVAPAPLRSEQT